MSWWNLLYACPQAQDVTLLIVSQQKTGLCDIFLILNCYKLNHTFLRQY